MTQTALQPKLGILDFLKMIYQGHPEYSLIAVKSPIDQVVTAFIEFTEGQTTKTRRDYKTFRNQEIQITDRRIRWVKDVPVQLRDPDADENYEESDDSFEWGIPFVQVKDSEWTVILRSLSFLGMDEINSVPRETEALSKQLQTKAIMLLEEDTSGAIAYELFENGEQQESFEVAPGDAPNFSSVLRERPAILATLDEDEDEDNWDREFDITQEKRVQFVNELFCELGAYLPACWYFRLNGKPAMQVEEASQNTIDRADWLIIGETLQETPVQADEDDAE